MIELSLFKLIPDDLSEQMVVLFLSSRIEVSGSGLLLIFYLISWLLFKSFLVDLSEQMVVLFSEFPD